MVMCKTQLHLLVVTCLREVIVNLYWTTCMFSIFKAICDEHIVAEPSKHRNVARMVKLLLRSSVRSSGRSSGKVKGHITLLQHVRSIIDQIAYAWKIRAASIARCLACVCLR
jgi:hypothetical protein